MKFLIFLFTTLLINKTIENEDRNYWLNLGKEQLRKNVKAFPSRVKGRAKNILLFIGEGMGPTTVTATRIYKALLSKKPEGEPLNFERLPYTGISKTYSVDKQVPDSAATATALLTGVKTKSHVIAMDGTVELRPCENTDIEKLRMTSIVAWAIRARKSAGIVTNSRITDATSAAVYAHSPVRDWECSVPESYRDCYKDIGKQLVEDFPGRELKVILGGGKDYMGITHEKECTRDENLVKKWEMSKMKKRAFFVSDVEELKAINPSKVDYLMGLFSNRHMAFELEKDKLKQPSLKEMTEIAVKILRRNKNGYFLVVVSGLINHAHAHNFAKLVLSETVEFDNAVQYAIENTNVEDTLIIVTGGFGEGLGMLGYADRGTDILEGPNTQNSPWDTLFYGTGPFGRKNESRSIERIGNRDKNSLFYQANAAFYSEEGVNSGVDVPVYASGPGAELLVGSYEQNYVAHVISYATGITSNATRTSSDKYFVVMLLLYLFHIATCDKLKCDCKPDN